MTHPAFKLGNGKIVRTWEDFMSHVYSVIDENSKPKMDGLIERYKREGKTAPDLCEDFHRIMNA